MRRDLCPICKWPVYAHVDGKCLAPGVAKMAMDERRGRELWRQLHLRPFSPTLNLPTEPAWINSWLDGVRCGSCMAEAKAWVAGNPPDASSADALFAWGWRFHESINRKLGKPAWTLAEATDYWQNYKESVMEEFMPSAPTFDPTDKEIIGFNLSGGIVAETVGNNPAKMVDNLSISTRRLMTKADGSLPREIRPAKVTPLGVPPVLPASATEADKAKAAAIVELHDTIYAAVKKALAILE